MLSSLSIRNYRCFTSLDLSDLTRINILVGENAAGKTAFLEAVFQMCGTAPELELRTSSWRGAIQSPISFSRRRSDYDSLWKYLFHQLKTENAIYISGDDSLRGRRSLQISFSEEAALLIGEGEEIPEMIQPLVFRWKVNGREYQVIAEMDANSKLDFKGEFPPAFPIIFLSPTNPNPADDADRLSELAKRRHDQRVVSALSKHFPMIEDLHRLKHLGQDIIFAAIKDMPELIPIGYVSSGIKKFLSILLALAAHPKGVLLIDQLEDGLYFSTLPLVWELLLSWSKEFDSQIFISTHSAECLNSLSGILPQNEAEISVIRLENQKGVSVAHQFSGRGVRGVLEQGMDVR